MVKTDKENKKMTTKVSEITRKHRLVPIPSFIGVIAGWLNRLWEALKPGPDSWKGATIGLLVSAVFITLWTGYLVFQAPPRIASVLLGSVQFIAIAFIAAGLLVLLVALINRIPIFYGWSLIVLMILLYVSFFMEGTPSPPAIIAVMLSVILIMSMLGASAWVLAHGGWKTTSRVRLASTVVCLLLGLGGLAAGGSWLIGAGPAIEPPPNAAAMAATRVAQLAMPDPSEPGQYEVHTLFYGTGQDKNRPEYGSDVDLVTGSVDGSPFIGQGWNSERAKFWGFGPEAMPINARIWYPEGAGPFPLALIVHGDQVMYEFSDPGYDYLGELLASRGIILASVDANFLNHSAMSGLDDENDARGWLLLEHLRFWEAWNQTPGNPFYQKVDMNNIAVMGHSRGGEAAAIAASFNRLAYYPDDATVPFDYNYNIRSVVAIAPVFETYTPRGQHVQLENVNYFVLQGSNDSQILTFKGLSQYARVAFTDDEPRFKAALYIYGANHGQFNTVWVTDEMTSAKWLFNQRMVMPFKEQKQVAEVYITAFLEATLRGESGYIPLFRDYRVAPGWLPDTIYLNQFQDSTYQLISTYEEDMSVDTTTIPGGEQSGENLTVWREHMVELFGAEMLGPIDTSAVYLGWDAESSQGVASYAISLPDGGLVPAADSSLVFSLADANEDPTPGVDADDDTGPREPIDLTIEVTDRSGQTAKLPLSSFSYLQPQIVNIVRKAAFMNIGGPSPSESVFQSFGFPLSAFMETNSAFDPASLVTVRLIFDRTTAGVVVLDDVGFRN